MRRSRVLLSIGIFVMMAMLIASIGVTAAIWSGAGGENVYTPSVPSTDWNIWAKYFVSTPVQITETTGVISGLAITGYSGTNIKDVIIPSKLKDANGIEQHILEIRIPSTVKSIQTNAFSGLTNLRKVTIAGSSCTITAHNSTPETPCSVTALNCKVKVNEYAFSGCTSLNSFNVEIGGIVTLGNFVFLGDMKLTHDVDLSKYSLNKVAGATINISSMTYAGAGSSQWGNI